MSASLPGPLRSLFARSPGPLCPGKAQQHLPEPLDLGSVPLAAQPGLHLLNSDWNAAHLCAQAHEGEQSGIFDLWHAIAHRTEGGEEYWNAKYWISHVSHPQLPALYPAKSLAGSRALAKERVDAVEACVVSGQGDEERLKTVVWDEIKALTEWCLLHGERS